MGRSSMPTVFLLPALLLAALAATAKSLTLKPDCQPSCGGVDIPYPFGIGQGCFRPGFEVTCINNTTPGLPANGTIPGPIPVLNVSVMPRPEARVMLPVAYQCYNVKGRPEGNTSYGQVRFNRGSMYRISNTHNDLVVLGCNTFGSTYAGPPGRLGNSYYAGCVAYCKDSRSAQDGACAGIGCCRVDIPPGLPSTWIQFHSDWDHSNQEFSPCDYAFMVEKGNYTFQTADLLMDKRTTMPLVVDWAIRDTNVNSTDDNYSCAQAPNRPDYACVSDHSKCVDSYNGPGYVCNCTTGYGGNPYLQNGCTDIDECARPQEEFPCHGECQNTEGSYSCKCRQGYESSGDPKENLCNPKFPLAAKLALGIHIDLTLVSKILS